MDVVCGLGRLGVTRWCGLRVLFSFFKGSWIGVVGLCFSFFFCSYCFDWKYRNKGMVEMMDCKYCVYWACFFICFYSSLRVLLCFFTFFVVFIKYVHVNVFPACHKRRLKGSRGEGWRLRILPWGFPSLRKQKSDKILFFYFTILSYLFIILTLAFSLNDTCYTREQSCLL